MANAAVLKKLVEVAKARKTISYTDLGHAADDLTLQRRF